MQFLCSILEKTKNNTLSSPQNPYGVSRAPAAFPSMLDLEVL
jgi:hypothetical protein